MFQTLKKNLFLIPFLIINTGCLTTVKRADWHNTSVLTSVIISPLNKEFGLMVSGETGILDIQKKGGIKTGLTFQMLSQNDFQGNMNELNPEFYFFDHLTFSVRPLRKTYIGISVDMALLQPFRTEFLVEQQFYKGSFLFNLTNGYYGDMANLERYGEIGFSVVWGEPINIFLKLFSRTYPEKEEQDKWIIGLYGGFGWEKHIRF